MTSEQVRSVFHREYNGHMNPFTPVVVEYGRIGRFLYELSRQHDQKHELMKFGLCITVLEQSNGEIIRRHDLSVAQIENKTEKLDELRRLSNEQDE